MEKKQLRQIIKETSDFLNSKNVNFICCIWDKDGECRGGCRSIDANMGSALTAVEILVKALSTILEDIRREAEETEETEMEKTETS